MPPIDFSPKLSPRFIVYLRDFLLDRNINPEKVFLKSGIEEIAESELALPVSTTKVLSLFDSAAEECTDDLIGFNLARHFHFESSSVIVMAMLAAPTVREGLITLHLFDKYVDSGITTSYDFSGKQASYTVTLLGIDGKQTQHLNEYVLTFTTHALNVATRTPMPLKQVHFQHLRTSNQTELEDFFNAEILYEQDSNTLFFDGEHLDQHMHTSNELLYEILQSAMKTYFSTDESRHGFIDSVCRQLMRQSEIKTTDLQFVADALTMSTRTLRRRIKAEGFTFQQIKNLARERQTKYYLTTTNKTLSEIAFELGYTEMSSFSRAFKKWTGSTPQEYRATARKLISS